MLVSGVVVVALLIGLVLFVWWLACLIQALQYGDSLWAAADQSKWLFVALMVVLGPIGTLAFVIVARPELRRVARSAGSA